MSGLFVWLVLFVEEITLPLLNFTYTSFSLHLFWAGLGPVSSQSPYFDVNLVNLIFKYYEIIYFLYSFLFCQKNHSSALFILFFSQK
jgi:hypothetical protein